MSDIFICYSRKDSSIATKLMQHFEELGWDVFIDKQTRTGRRWHQEIERELHNSKAVVVLWSGDSRESDYVLEEAEYGKRKDILFPAFITQVEPPYGFSRIQTVNLIDWKGETSHSDLKQLTYDLQLHLNGNIDKASPQEYSQPVNPPPTPPIKKFLWIAALVFSGFVIFPMVEWFYGQLFQVEGSDEDELLPEMILIPAGSFTMGEQDETFINKLYDYEKERWGIPTISVNIKKPFYLGKTEITYEQYDYYIQSQQKNGKQVASPETVKGGQPVANVNWSEAINYATWLGEQTQQSCRLPTEAEWEYAARAGNKTAYPWGNRLGTNNVNCRDCGSQWDAQQSAPVASFAANVYQLHDMSGSLWEWTCSSWSAQFNGSEQQCTNDSANTEGRRVVRGGSWSSHPDYLRSSSRNHRQPGYPYDYIGFRVLCSPLNS